MLKEVKWSEDGSYKTTGVHQPFEFFLQSLCNSDKFDLLLGYFSSAAINVLSLGFATFLYNGGRVRIIANNIMSEKDKNAFIAADEGDGNYTLIDLSNINKLRLILDDYGKHFFECLAWLISNKRIHFKIIRPKNGQGISHYKNGIFYDKNDCVGFSASCNFTAYGLLENLERLDAFWSWEDSRSTKFIDGIKKDFEYIFLEKDNQVEYLSVSEIEVAIKKEFGDKSLNELMVQEVDLLKKRSSIFKNKNASIAIENAINNLEVIETTPKFPYPEGPRKYQQEAYNNWVANDYKGLFAMATGTGKTITALNCVLEEFRLNHFYKFIVLVPTISLAAQWNKELLNEFNFDQVTICSSMNSNWEQELRGYARSIKLGSKISFCILTTYASFRGKRFQSIIGLFGVDMKNMILIADEAHTLGSKKLLKVLPIKIEKRIGLSATPERQYDDEGELAISDFFNSYAPNYTFSYNMKKAIEDRVLCRYNYYPKIVELENEELIAYKNFTKQLNKYLDPQTGRYKDNPYVSNLLIKRKNIIHKARNKSKCLINIVESIGENNFRYAFIYVPEGYEPNYAEEDMDEVDQEDESIINKYTEMLYDKYHFKLRKFTGETKNRDEILNQFSQGKINALLAMKCLDEGVDIPQTQFAIFCSSTGNARQYIQRRGRVLRYHPSKEFAEIYDMIVMPTIEITDTDKTQFRLERNILASELKRLVNFAVLAENKDECLLSIEGFAYNFDIDVYDLANKEEEKYKN